MLMSLIGLIAGLSLGLTGAGGSVIAVPLLVQVAGLSLTSAAPMALLAVCLAAATGTLSALRVGLVRYRAATVMAIAGVLTAPLGLRVAHTLPGPTLSIVFGGVLMVIAARMWLQARATPAETRIVRAHLNDDAPEHEAACRLNPGTGRFIWTRPCTLAMMICGALMGFLSGLLGVGGGFVAVPALRKITTLPMHSAVATSLMTIALTSAGTVVSAWTSGYAFDVMQALPFVAGTVAGMLVSRAVAPRMAGPGLQQGFAAMLAVVAVTMIVT